MYQPAAATVAIVPTAQEQPNVQQNEAFNWIFLGSQEEEEPPHQVTSSTTIAAPNSDDTRIGGAGHTGGEREEEYFTMNFLNAVGNEGNAQQVEDTRWLEGYQLFPTNPYEEPPFDMDAMDMDALFTEITTG